MSCLDCTLPGNAQGRRDFRPFANGQFEAPTLGLPLHLGFLTGDASCQEKVSRGFHLGLFVCFVFGNSHSFPHPVLKSPRVVLGKRKLTGQ